jgi:hypothetical protein
METPSDHLPSITEFDLTPDPRVLSMLGEITLPEWKCLAEFIDNSIDGFLSAQRASLYIQLPQVNIAVPYRDDTSARVIVKDNGPGMSPEILEWSVRAGFSGNDPVNNLGLFGMGFNIATARLGMATRVYSARAEDKEWTGLEIDFECLARQRNFRTLRLTRPKINPNDHGTEVEIVRLKPAARAFFANAANRSKINKELSRVYSAMLRPEGVPIHFMLKVNNNKVVGRRHCVWNESRSVQVADMGEVSAFQSIDVSLGERRFCIRCWQWLGSGDGTCATCSNSSDVITRQRRVHGWIGIQRYVHPTDYGIDLLRNGRKIELSSKDLFSWTVDDTDVPELEYPIDDMRGPRGRGRIVGEIHIDHCRVTYTKDRFDRGDVAWSEMLRVVRGDGPVLPRKAAELGFGPNESPFARLHRAFRRNSPHSQTAGAYSRILFVKDNDRAEEMAKKFHDGDATYQDDHKWWELVEEADRELLLPAGQRGGGHASRLRNFGGFDGPGGKVASTEVESNLSDLGNSEPGPVVPPRRSIASLSSEYLDEITRQRWQVEAFDVLATDPELCSYGEPWSMRMSASGVSSFYVNLSHSIFRSSTLTPLDAVLSQLAVNAVETVSRSVAERPTFARVLASLRSRYANQHRLDPSSLSADANQVLADISRGVAEGIENPQGSTFFDELSSSDQESTQRKMANQSVPNPQGLIDDGRFLEYVPRRALLDFFERHPELFLDGRYWDMEYVTVDYGSDVATDEARNQIVSGFRSLLIDAVWLDERDLVTLTEAPRARIVRAAAALELLRREGEAQEQ